jgi:hypothetical protein
MHPSSYGYEDAAYPIGRKWNQTLLATHTERGLQRSAILESIQLDAALKTKETLQLAAETACVGTWHLSVPQNELRSQMQRDVPFLP